MCHVIHQYEKSTTSTQNYDLNKESSYLMYWDVKNVYGWVMSLGLNEEKTSLCLMKNSYRTMIYDENSDKGCILEVDVNPKTAGEGGGGSI